MTDITGNITGGKELPRKATSGKSTPRRSSKEAQELRAQLEEAQAQLRAHEDAKAEVEDKVNVESEAAKAEVEASKAEVEASRAAAMDAEKAAAELQEQLAEARRKEEEQTAEARRKDDMLRNAMMELEASRVAAKQAEENALQDALAGAKVLTDGRGPQDGEKYAVYTLNASEHLREGELQYVGVNGVGVQIPVAQKVKTRERYLRELQNATTEIPTMKSNRLTGLDSDVEIGGYAKRNRFNVTVHAMGLDA